MLFLVADKDKPILRYGFHRTHDCQNFDKAFICVRKCLDLNYQIAHADKNCICTCYKNNILAKYKSPINTASTKWKLGAPTTSRPSWAGGNVEKKPNDYEINANYTEFIEETEGPEDEAGNDAPEGEEGEGVTGDDIGVGEGSGEAGETTGDPEEVAGDTEAPPDEEAEAAPAPEEAEEK